MNEERRRILDLVQNKTLNASEGVALLGALEPVPDNFLTQPSPTSNPKNDWRWLVIRVSDRVSGRRKVHVRMPYRLMEFGLRMGNIAGFDATELRETINQVENGSLLEVIDEEDGEHVQIYLE